jgi:hypothetical protein
MKQPSRLDAARRNVRVARYAIGIGAAVGLAAFAAAARVSHPGSSHVSPARAATPASAEEAGDDGFFSGDDGSYSIGPSGSASPQIQSGGS